MTDDSKLELGKALLKNIDAHRSKANARTADLAAAVLSSYERSDVENKFFTDLDAMRDKDPDAFARVSSPMKVAYAEWKHAQR